MLYTAGMWLVREKKLGLVLHLLGAVAAGTCAVLLGATPGPIALYLPAWLAPVYLAGILRPPRALSAARRLLTTTIVAVALLAVGWLLLGGIPGLGLAGLTVVYSMAAPRVSRWLTRERRDFVVVGTGALARRVERAVASRGEGARAVSVPVGQENEGSLAGRLMELADNSRAPRLTAVVADPNGSLDRLSRLLAPTRRVELVDAVSFLERVEGKVPVEDLPPGWHLDPCGFRLTRSMAVRATKRAADITLSLLGLILAAPIMFLAALGVRANSRGPAFFRQVRTGRLGRPFTMRKLRTMVVHDPKVHSPYAAQQDPRLTAVGAFLRRVHLDELPQLLNILRGEMSLVGPRAEWTVLSEEYARKVPHYRLRHLVRPGLTGWAQVCYPYGRSVEDALEKLRYDLFYIKHYSLFLDVVVLVRTVKAVLGLTRGTR